MQIEHGINISWRQKWRGIPRNMFLIFKTFQIETMGFKILWLRISSFFFLILFSSSSSSEKKFLLWSFIQVSPSGSSWPWKKEGIGASVETTSHLPSILMEEIRAFYFRTLEVHSKPSTSTPLFTDVQRIYEIHSSLLGSVRAKDLGTLLTMIYASMVLHIKNR